jgi:hypothetical protein
VLQVSWFFLLVELADFALLAAAASALAAQEALAAS